MKSETVCDICGWRESQEEFNIIGGMCMRPIYNHYGFDICSKCGKRIAECINSVFVKKTHQITNKTDGYDW